MRALKYILAALLILVFFNLLFDTGIIWTGGLAVLLCLPIYYFGLRAPKEKNYSKKSSSTQEKLTLDQSRKFLVEAFKTLNDWKASKEQNDVLEALPTYKNMKGATITFRTMESKIDSLELSFLKSKGDVFFVKVKGSGKFAEAKLSEIEESLSNFA